MHIITNSDDTSKPPRNDRVCIVTEKFRPNRKIAGNIQIRKSRRRLVHVLPRRATFTLAGDVNATSQDNYQMAPFVANCPQQLTADNILHREWKRFAHCEHDGCIKGYYVIENKMMEVMLIVLETRIRPRSSWSLCLFVLCLQFTGNGDANVLCHENYHDPLKHISTIWVNYIKCEDRILRA